MERKNGHLFAGTSFLNADFLLYLFFSGQGRISRKQFWMGLGVLLFLGLVLLIMAIDLKELELYHVDKFILIACALLFAMLSIKRFHDLGRSGHYTWLLIIPLVNLWCLYMLLCVHGSVDANKYGIDPLSTESKV